MSIRHILSPDELHKISNTDRRYLKRRINEKSAINRLLNRPINQRILHELQCILDKQPLPRQKPGQFVMGQICRLSDGIRYPCFTRKMNDEERVKYGVKEVLA